MADMRELLREGRRLCSDAPDDVEAWVKWCREVETALAQEPDLCIHGQHPADGCEKCAALAQQPEPVARVIETERAFGLSIEWLRDPREHLTGNARPAYVTPTWR